MKKPQFYLLYLFMIVCQAVVLAVCGIMVYTWQYWAIMMTTILGAFFNKEAYTK